MEPSERITVIKRTAQRLAEEGWTDLYLTLRQFGIELWGEEEDNPDFYASAVSFLNDASDQQLQGLQDHFFPGVEAGPGATTGIKGPWKDRHFRLFTSHTHPHSAFAGSLREAHRPVRQLGRQGARCPCYFYVHE